MPALAMPAALRRSHYWATILAVVTACSAGDKSTGTPGGGTDNAVATVQLTEVPIGLILVGDSTLLVAAALNAAGAVVPAATITWSSSVPSVATVSARGLLLAADAGTTVITVTSAGHTAQATIMVAIGATFGETGGSLSAAAGRFKVTLPVGALSQPTQLIVRAAPTAPSDPRALSATAFDITPPSVSFFFPALLTLQYDAATLPAALAGESLQLYVLDGTTWTRVFGSTVSIATHSVTGAISRTGTYIVRSTAVERIVLSGIAVDGAMYVGDSSSLIAHLFGSLGDSLPTRPITWSSSAPGIVSIDASGKLKALLAGTAVLTASTDGRVASTTTTVTTRTSADWSRAAEWTTYEGNAQHTAYVDASVDPSAFRPRWSNVPIAGGYLFQVTTGGDRAFVTSEVRVLGIPIVAVDAANGAARWQKDFGFFVGQPTWENGFLYAQTSGAADSYLYALNAADGTQQYRAAYENQFSRYDAPIIIGSSVIMGGGRFGGVWGMAKATGAQLFSRAGSQTNYWTPAADNGIAYITDGGITGLSPTGAVTMQLDDPRLTEAVTPVIATTGTLLEITQGHLYSVNLASRTVSWDVANEFDGVPVAGNGTVYAFGIGGVNALSVASGASLWTWTPPDTCLDKYGMVITNNVLFVSCAGTDTGTTYAIDLGTHLPVWSYPAGGYMALSGPQGVLYIAGGPTLTAISLR